MDIIVWYKAGSINFVDDQVPPQEEELNPIAGKVRSETSVWHSDVALPCDVNKYWHISIATWNHCSVQWIWRLIITPSSSQQRILQQIRYVIGSIATATAVFSRFCERETGNFLYNIEYVTIWNFIIVYLVLKTIFINSYNSIINLCCLGIHIKF